MENKDLVHLLIMLKNIDDSDSLDIKKRLVDFIMTQTKGLENDLIYDDASKLAKEINEMIEKMKRN